MKVRRRAFSALVAMLLLPLAPAGAEESCSGRYAELPLDEATAEAGVLANLTSRAGALKVEIHRLLTAAVERLPDATAPESACPAGCAAAGSPAIVLRTVPSSYLDEYPEKSSCARLLAQTKKELIVYSNRRFGSIDEVQDWFWELSTGRGADGEDLYSRCPGACSPQYTTLLTPTNGSFLVDTRIVCGHARDKSDDKYKLAVLFRWECASS